MRCWCSRVTQPRSTTKLFPSCYDITNQPLPQPHRLLRCRQHSLRTACVCYWNNSFAGKYVGRFLVLSEPCWHHLSVMLMLSSELCTAPRSGPVTAALFPVSVLGIFFSPDVLLAQWWHDSPPVSQILIVNSLVTNNQNEAQILSASHTVNHKFFTHRCETPAERCQESPQIKKNYRWYHKLETQFNTKYSRWHWRNFRRRKESQTKLWSSQTSETKLRSKTPEAFLRQAKTFTTQTQL